MACYTAINWQTRLLCGPAQTLLAALEAQGVKLVQVFL